jgi:hypothetical protein
MAAFFTFLKQSNRRATERRALPIDEELLRRGALDLVRKRRSAFPNV